MVQYSDSWTPAGNFGIVSDTDTTGGFRVVADSTERLAIPNLRRKQGMRVVQSDTGAIYRLTTTNTGTLTEADFELDVSGSTGYVQFNNGGLLGSSANLFWDIANNRLGIGTASPNYNLAVTGTLGVSGTATFASDVVVSGQIKPTGLSTSWGTTSGTDTGGVNVTLGTSTSATWLISGTSNGTFRGGIQQLDAGNGARWYTNGTSQYAQLSSGGLSLAVGSYTGALVNAITFNNGGAGVASGTTFNNSAARTISYNTIGAPSTTGTGASGTWNINITGSAQSAASLGAYNSTTGLPEPTGTRTVLSSGVYTYNVYNLSLGDSTPDGSYWSVLGFGRGIGGMGQLATSWTSNGTELYFRSLRDTTDNWWAWKEILHSSNYNSYSPTLTGTGASGTWGISITGNANTLDNLDSTSFIRSDADDTISGDLNTTAAISYTQGVGVRVLQPEGGLLAGNPSSITGYIKITLPVSWTNTMMMFDVDIYDYGGDTDGESFKIQVGGYNYTVGPTWVNVFANILTGRTDKFFNVRFGHDGSKCAIYIGESTSTWNYPQISVSNVVAGYSQATPALWADGWSIEITTTLGTITRTKTLENVASEALTAGTTTGTSTLRGPTSGFLLTPSDDTDTGLYDSGTNTLGFYTANGERMRIDSAGNVGIGQPTPGYKLDVTGQVRATSGFVGNLTGNADTVTISSLGPAFNNMGQTHSTRTSFDATTPSYDFGWRYIQGSANGPGTGGTQFYSLYVGLGSQYPATGAGSYGMMLAIDRDQPQPYLSVRYNEGNNFSTWRRISAGYADNANMLDNLDSTSFVRSDADDTISGDLDTTAAISYTQGIGVRVLQPQGGMFTTTISAHTGYIKITLPVSWTNTMMMFDVDIFDYDGGTDGESFKIQVGGYNFGSTSSWYNVFANILTGRTDKFFNVRFGHDGSKCAIYIGESTSTWNYPQISVSNFVGGHTNATAANWADGWSIEITTTLGTITQTKTLENVASEALTAGTTTGTSTLRGPTSGFLLTPSDDTDTGLYDSGADTLGFYTANGERMRIDSAGNVGIGTTGTVSYKLQVEGTGFFRQDVTIGDTTTAADRFLTVLARNENRAEIRAMGDGGGCGVVFVGQSSNGGGGIFYNGGGSPQYATGSAADRISFFRRNAGQNHVVFDYSVGDNNVDFKGNASFVGDLAVNGGDITTTATSFNLLNTTATTLNFAGASTALTIGATTGTTYIRNNVGIGTANPDQTLHVHKGSAGILDAHLNSTIVAENSVDSYVSILAPNASTKGILFGEPTSAVRGGILYFGSAASPADQMQFRTANNQTRMVIDSAGNVGIGTTSPNYNLAVTGTLGVSGTATFAGTVNAATFVGNLTNAITFNNGGAGVASGTTFNNSAARTISYNTIGAPSTTGTGASGTWGINITGNAATATTAGYLTATDDRDMKPNTSGIGANILGIKAFFSTLEGMTGAAGTDYQDVLVLDTYNDNSGGNANALIFDKSSHVIRHYQASQTATSWGTPKTLAYTDGTGASGTWGINITGEVSRTIPDGNLWSLVSATIGTNDFFRIAAGGANNAGYAEIATADDGTEPIYVRQYTGVFSTLTRTATLLDGSGNTSFPGTVTAPSFSGNLNWQGVASPAGANPAAGLYVQGVYSNGYPTTYGNVLTMGGGGYGQLLLGWSGTSGAHANNYIRSLRDSAVSTGQWSPWALIWTNANHGAGSGLDADTVDGLQPTSDNVGNTIMTRNVNGDTTLRYGYGNYFNSTDDVSNGTISHIMAKFGDNFYRSATAAKVASFISGQSMNIAGSSTSCTGNAATVTNGVYTIGDQTIGGTKTFSSGIVASAGIYLGGTTAVNHLDDYEEGTFTPTYNWNGTLVTGALSQGTYVKIGRLVYINVYGTVTAPSTSTNATFAIQGLPFAVLDIGTAPAIQINATRSSGRVNAWSVINTSEVVTAQGETATGAISPLSTFWNWTGGGTYTIYVQFTYYTVN